MSRPDNEYILMSYNSGHKVILRYLFKMRKLRYRKVNNFPTICQCHRIGK